MNNHSNHNRSSSKIAVIIGGIAAVAIIGAAALYLVDVDQTQEARLPNVDIAVKEGQMPKFDVDVADVDLETENVTVDVPTIDVETETRTIEVEVPIDANVGSNQTTISVPTINVEKPESDDPAGNPDK